MPGPLSGTPPPQLTSLRLHKSLHPSSWAWRGVPARWNQGRTKDVLHTGGFRALVSIFHSFRGTFRNSEGRAHGRGTKPCLTVLAEPSSHSSQGHQAPLLASTPGPLPAKWRQGLDLLLEGHSKKDISNRWKTPALV